MSKLVLDETILSGQTRYVPLAIRKGTIGAQIGWKDATSNATITLELTSYKAKDAPVDQPGDAWKWLDSGETVTGPDATGAGGSFVHVENVRGATRARLKIETAADSALVIHDGAPSLLSLRGGGA